MAGPRVAFQSRLFAGDVVYALPARFHIAGGTPKVAAQRGRPLPRRIPAVLAERKHNGTARSLERLAHFVIGRNHQFHLRGLVMRSLLLHDLWDETAKVVFEVVEAPFCVGLGILLLV